MAILTFHNPDDGEVLCQRLSRPDLKGWYYLVGTPPDYTDSDTPVGPFLSSHAAFRHYMRNHGVFWSDPARTK